MKLIYFAINNQDPLKLFELKVVYNTTVIQQGVPNTFFLENALKKTTEFYLKFLFFYLKVQSFRLIMENNSIQMADSAVHAVTYTIGSIFKHIIDCVQLYFTNGFTNIFL